MPCVVLYNAFRRSLLSLLVIGIASLLGVVPSRGAPPATTPWHAQWIMPASLKSEKSDGAGKPAKLENLWICYRKTFTLSDFPPNGGAGKPPPAITRIAVDSRYWLWVNGQQVVFEGGLKRGPNPTDTYYDTVNLSRYLVKGNNTVAILAWYWGKDGFSHKSSGQPGLLFELNAGGQTIVSDSSWSTRLHPAYGNTQGRQPNFRLSESPIRFDARADIEGWTATSYPDGDWQSPVEMGLPPAAPWNQLWRRPIPQWKNSGLCTYANAASLPSESTGQPIIAQLPYNAQVTPYLKIDAPPGLTLTLSTDDRLNEIYTQYVTRGGVQEFETFAWMNGHNVIYDIPKGIKILTLKYRETGYNTELSGAFTCNDEVLSRLWTKAQRTLYITMRDNFMDCPDRERAQWWGDAVNEIGETFYALSPSANALSQKAISNLVEWQRPNHAVFSPCPAGNWDKELPPQMLASVGKYGFWTYYLATGDRQTMVEAYPHVRDYLTLWKLDADGLVIHRAGEWDWADWGDNIDARLLDNAWLCLALEGAANMAELLDKNGEAAEYRATRKSLIAAINQHLWNGQAYRTPTYKGATDDRGNGLAVVAGIADPAKYPAIKQVLATERHASPYMEKYILEALALMDDPEATLARMEERYRTIVASPMTTLPEEWGGGTDNHAWSGGPLTILSQYIAGIAPIAPAYKTYQVRPQIGHLTSLHTVVDTVQGTIELTLSRDTGHYRLTLQSPQGTTALVCLPASNAHASVKVNGKIVWKPGTKRAKTGGVTFKDADAEHVRFTVPAGIWKFEAE